MLLRVRATGKTLESPIVHSGIPQGEKGQHEQIQTLNNVGCLFDAKGVVHRPQGQTVNVASYVNIQGGLSTKIDRLYHHDNAGNHKCLWIHVFLTTHKMATMSHTAYSSNLAQTGPFFLFPMV